MDNEEKAFPLLDDKENYIQQGMDLRDYFAASIASSININDITGTARVETIRHNTGEVEKFDISAEQALKENMYLIAKEIYLLADAMIEVRKK